MTEGNFFVGVFRCMVYLFIMSDILERSKQGNAVIPSILRFMPTNYTQKTVALEELAGCVVPSDVITLKLLQENRKSS